MSLKEEQDILFMSSLQNSFTNNLQTQYIKVSAITTERLNNRLETASYTIAKRYMESERLLKVS